MYPELYVLNYNQIDSPKNHPITNECRSLVLGSKDNGLTFFAVSRAFDRFYNMFENDYAPDVSELACYEKIDGSLISVFHYNGEWLYRTKSMIMPTLPINWGERTWKDVIEEALGWENMKNILEEDFIEGWTHILEVVSFENRVVVKYKETKAYWLAARTIDDRYSVSRKKIL